MRSNQLLMRTEPMRKVLGSAILMLLLTAGICHAGPAEEDLAEDFSDKVMVVVVFTDQVLLQVGLGSVYRLLPLKAKVEGFEIVSLQQDSVKFSDGSVSVTLKQNAQLAETLNNEIPEAVSVRIKAYRKQLQQDEKDYKTIYNLAYALVSYQPAEAYSLLKKIPEAAVRLDYFQVIKSLAMLKMQAFKDVVDYLTQCIENSPAKISEETIGIHFYNRACAFSLWGKKSKALDDLAKSLKLYRFTAEEIENDPDLDAIRAEPEYRKIIESLR
ncbi:hypothetical protein ACFL54_04000 [Planctomycetota bacterium]